MANPAKLTTIERFDPMYSLAKERLHQQYGDSVSCHKGNVQEVLPDILNSMAKVNLRSTVQATLNKIRLEILV
jgi:hypothetical protein